ncbi:hypothetical protein B0O99DRAFT_618867 [Bisporella sp. PMI_857]|nr:hypothetical protein B0O99DRAFT_618867 [Bisporella sp. PMI_857]
MDSYLSSPDPLNDSPAYYSPTKSRRPSGARQSLPIDGSSPTKQTFELEVGNQISPQKIRVTVEAGNSDTENAWTDSRHASPSPVRRRVNKAAKLHREKTTTITVPVKGLSDSEEEAAATPKRGRGRPRKSGTPVPANKHGRAGTPKQKKRRSIGSLVDGDDSEDFNFHLGHGVDTGRRKGRSRSKSAKGSLRKSVAADEMMPLNRAMNSPGKKGRGRRKSFALEQVEVLEDDMSRSVDDNAREVAETSGPLSSMDVNASYHPFGHSPNRLTTQGPGNGAVSQSIGTLLASHEDLCHPLPPELPRTTSETYESDIEAHSNPASPAGTDHFSDEEEDDAVRGYQDFDTIMESEGFSMISVDSVPSLRDHLSSPANIDQSNVSIAPIRYNRTLGNHESETADTNDSFSSVPEAILEAATPGRSPRVERQLSVKDSHIDDSFSSIPPDILEAATPGRRPKPLQRLAINNSRLENSLLKSTPTSLQKPVSNSGLVKSQDDQVRSVDSYEDSFSAISPEILEAATPAPTRRILGESQSYQKMPPPNLSMTNQNQSSLRINTESIVPRLPTPEDTPSPGQELLNGQSLHSVTQEREERADEDAASSKASNNSSLISQMRSSPPSMAPRRYTYTAHLLQRRELYPNETQTPSIVFSSPSLPPPFKLANGYPVLSSRLDSAEQHKLSPTVRAGRLLQDLIVPSSSPRARAQSLGSPFKSPVAERKTSSSLGPDPSSPAHEKHIKPFPKLDANGSYFPERFSNKTTDDFDDPFRNDKPHQQQSPSSEEKQGYTLELPSKPLSDPRLSTITSEGHSYQSDDAMSWQAEEVVRMNDAAPPLLKNVNPLTTSKLTFKQAICAAEGTALTKEIAGADTKDASIISSENEDSEDEVSYGDELLLETINSSSPAATDRQPKANNLEKPRRTKIPSPWRKNSTRLISGNEPSHTSPPKAGKPSLAKRTVHKPDESADVELSEFVIPQKANFKPMIRDRGLIDLSVLLSSPSKAPLPILSRGLQDSSFIPASTASNSTATIPRMEQPFVPIPQKVGFNPQVRDRRQLEESSPASSPVRRPVINGIFGINPYGPDSNCQFTPEFSSSSLDIRHIEDSSPSRDIILSTTPPAQTEQLASPPSSHDYETMLCPEGKESEMPQPRIPQWTETLHLTSANINAYTSPTKSCLRSPLKTPRLTSCPGAGDISPSKTVAFVSSSPIPSSPPTVPLSSTQWSQAHWTLLQSIVHSWKPENQPSSEPRRRNSTRVISKLLGKKISNGGEKLRLEQWHLEAVDEFRGEVPGWEELVIAKRLFALLVGERLRAEGVCEWKGGEKVREMA